MEPNGFEVVGLLPSAVNIRKVYQTIVTAHWSTFTVSLTKTSLSWPDVPSSLPR